MRLMSFSVLTALCDSPAGTELTGSYIDNVLEPRYIRQANLRRNFGFKCLCTACSVPPQIFLTSDNRLARCSKLMKRWAHPRTSKQVLARMEWAEDLLKARKDIWEAQRILREESKYDAIGDALQGLFWILVVYGHGNGAVKVGKQIMTHYEMTVGKEKAEESYGAVAEDPECHEDWEMMLRCELLRRRCASLTMRNPVLEELMG